MDFEDFVYPSALHGDTLPHALLFHSVQDARAHAHPPHSPLLYLEHLDSGEIQRAFNQKIPVILRVHSLQTAFDSLKMKGVQYVHVPLSAYPVIDAGWMNAAHIHHMRVVFSFPEMQRALASNHVASLMEFQKLIRLLRAAKVPFHIASFATRPEDKLSSPHLDALLAHFGVKGLARPREL